MAEAETRSRSGDCHNFQSILSSSNRDFLTRNNGDQDQDQVKIESLKGKRLGLYFSASWCGPCKGFTPMLEKVYSDLSSNGDFEIIFVSGDKDEEAFNAYFSKMPWLAIPFSDSDTRTRLVELFDARKIPSLVLLDENGQVITNDGRQIIQDYEEEAYPLTSEKIQELKDLEERNRKEQSLQTLLCSRTRDYVVRSDGSKVAVSELVGKTVGLLFSCSMVPGSVEFASKLAEFHDQLKEKGEDFEIVMVSLDGAEESYKKSFVGAWLAVPFNDKVCMRLYRYFVPQIIPAVVIIGADGKTLFPNVAKAIENHGIKAYPFTEERLEMFEAQ